MLDIISFGAGVQSTVMALMFAKGEISTPEGGRPEHLIFSDTGWEPRHVYEHLDWCEAELKRLTNGQMVLHRASAGNIKTDLLDGPSGDVNYPSSIPAFNAGGGMTSRQCTGDYKVKPLYKVARKIAGLEKGKRYVGAVRMHIGISTDEAIRMKPARVKWLDNYWPLIETGMSRSDCRSWFEKNYPGRRLAKSACIGCPFHNDSAWREMKRDDPESWADAVAVDRKIRETGKLFGVEQRNAPYLHRSLKPLDEADLGDESTLDLFGMECEGMCGV